MGQVTGKIAFITGGASGIGAKTAELLHREGAHIIIADINADLQKMPKHARQLLSS